MKKHIITILLMLSLIASPLTASAATVEELLKQIESLMVQINALKAQVEQQQGGSTGQFCYTFNRNLRIGDNGHDVSGLRAVLDEEGFPNSSESLEYRTFDENLASAVTEFQEKYASEILTPNNLRRGNGFVGKSTRAKLNALYGCKNGAVPAVPAVPGETSATPAIPASAVKHCPDTTINGYPVPARSNGESAKVTKGTAVANGSKNTTVVFVCSNGGFISKDEYSEVKCNEGYVRDYTDFYKDSCRAKTATTTATTIDSLTVHTPVNTNGSSIFTQGETLPIRWTSYGVAGVHRINLIPVTSGTKIEVYNAGTGFPNMASSYNWPIPTTAAPGNYRVYVQIGNDNGPIAALSPEMITINAKTGSTQPSIIVTSPNGGEVFSALTTKIPFSWKFSGVSVTNPVAYLIDQNGKEIYGTTLKYSATLKGTLIEGTDYLPAPLNLVIQTGTATYRIKICADGRTTCATGNPFTITKTTSSLNDVYPTAAITVLAPMSAETLKVGQQYTIRWSNAGLPSNATLHIWIQKGTYGPNAYIASKLPSTQTSYTWTVSENLDWGFGLNTWRQRITKLLGIKTVSADFNEYVIGVSASVPEGEIVTGKSSPFTITAPTTPTQPSITVTSPNTGGTFAPGNTVAITWQATNAGSGTVSIVATHSVYGNTTVTSGISAGTGAYSWVIPSSMPDGEYKITANLYAGSQTVSDSTDRSIVISRATVAQPVTPSVTSLSATNAKVGDQITVYGTGFASDTIVYVGTTAVRPSSIQSSQVTFTIPTVSATSHRVYVLQNGAYSNSITLTVTATEPATTVSAQSVTVSPAITAFDPLSPAPGSTVRVYGTGFTGAAVVYLNNTAITPSVNSSTELSFVVPSTSTAGSYKLYILQSGLYSNSTLLPVVVPATPTTSSTASPEGIILQSVRRSGDNLIVVYSKDFATCAHLVKNGAIAHDNNFFCLSGNYVTVSQPISSFSVSVGDQVKLCNGGNYAQCSSTVTVEGGAASLENTSTDLANVFMAIEQILRDFSLIRQ